MLKDAAMGVIMLGAISVFEVILSILSVILTMSLVVFIHELGHYIFARRAGIFVHEFAVGFGPKIWSKRSEKTGTIYSVRLILFGGYVKMAGLLSLENTEPELKKGDTVHIFLRPNNKQVDSIYLYEPSDKEKTKFIRDNMMAKIPNVANNWIKGTVDHFDFNKLKLSLMENEHLKTYDIAIGAVCVTKQDSDLPPYYIVPKKYCYDQKTIWHRFLTILAGPIFNLFLAMFLFIILTFASDTNYIKIANVFEDSNDTVFSQLKENDELVAINMWPVVGSKYTISVLDQSVSKEDPLFLTVKRDNTEKEIKLPPPITKTTFHDYVKLKISEDKASFISVLNVGVSRIGFQVLILCKALLGVFKEGTPLYGKERKLSGPLDILKIIYKVVLTYDVLNFIYILAILNVALCIGNLLPFTPVLDGGKLLILSVEFIRGKPLNKKFEMGLYVIGLIMLLLWMGYLVIGDIIGWFL